MVKEKKDIKKNMEKVRENIKQLKEKKGNYYEKWKARYEAGMEAYLKERKENK